MLLDLLKTGVVFLFILGIIVLIHEFGHFLFAKLFKVKVEEFAFGFGKMLLGKKIGETLYRINLLPFGGYVKLLGEESSVDSSRSYSTQTPLKRIIIILGGVFMNILLAIVVFYIYLSLNSFVNYIPKYTSFSFIGADVTEIKKTYISEVVPDFPAAKAGVAANSIIWSINGQEVKNGFDDFRNAILESYNKELEVTLLMPENNTFKTYKINVDKIDPQTQKPIVGVKTISSDIEFYKLDYNNYRLTSGFAHTSNILFYSIKSLAKLVTASINQKDASVIAEGTGSIVKVGQITYKFISADNFIDIVNLLGLINVSLAFMNILPIPALDGGHAMFILIEKIRGRKISDKIMEKVNTAGFGFLMFLFVILLFKDILDLTFVKNLIEGVKSLIIR